MKKGQYEIAVVLTCHNRKEKTLNCLKKLSTQEILSDVSLAFYCCDDGSTDGTKEILEATFSNVTIIKGDGQLYWAKGMKKAIEEAAKSMPDFFLMVNDDVDFFDDSIEIMLSSFNKHSHNDLSCIVGAVCDKDNNWTYGGQKWNISGIKVAAKKIYPESQDLSCNVANWNCFLIPRKIYEEVGDLDDYYPHGYADYDYSLRVVKKGYEIYSSDKYVGRCERNSVKGTWEDKTLNGIKRIVLMQDKKAKPLSADIHFYKKNWGKYWLIVLIKQYISVLLGH